MTVLISCEVGGDQVPTQFIGSGFPKRGEIETGSSQTLGKPRRRSAKKSHWSGALPPSLSCDATAQYVAKRMAEKLSVPLVANPFSPELIDVTRSMHHQQLFPPMTRQWSAEDRRELIETVYQPYRRQVQTAIRLGLERWGYLIHLSIRTFDLQWKGKERRADVGLLYDPSRVSEVDFCLDWIDEMYEEAPMLRVRRNYPRRGTTDRLTKSMRAVFAKEDYLGIEVMLNRAWAGRPLAIRDEAIDRICWSLQAVTELGQASEAA